MDRKTPATDAFSREYSNIPTRETWESLDPGQKRSIIMGAIHAAKENGALSVFSNISDAKILEYIMKETTFTSVDVVSQMKNVLDDHQFGDNECAARSHACDERGLAAIGGFEKLEALNTIIRRNEL